MSVGAIPLRTDRDDTIASTYSCTTSHELGKFALHEPTQGRSPAIAKWNACYRTLVGPLLSLILMAHEHGVNLTPLFAF